jgi:hypothetical protein
MIDAYRQRTSVVEPAREKCLAEGESTDILVCGRNDAAMRIPLPEERAPDPNRPYHGEPRLDPGPPCPPTGCTGIDFIKGATFLYRLAHKIIDPDS